ncbi:unnamed protein product [Oreochromis niloticus]|nr:unnamed protein product [Mustela putorius furo]
MTPSPATPRIQRICDQIKFLVEAKTMKIFSEFLALNYHVGNENEMESYRIKVDVGGSKCIVVDVSQRTSLNAKTIHVIDVNENHSSDEAIKPF